MSPIDPADIEVLRQMQAKYQTNFDKITTAKSAAMDRLKAKYDAAVQGIEERAKADERQINAFQSVLSQLLGATTPPTAEAELEIG